jgi:4-hydroxybenzoate polyprenyltransferase
MLRLFKGLLKLGAGLVVAAALAGYHFTLIRGRSREGCFKAFLHNNWLGGAVFAGILADQALRA